MKAKTIFLTDLDEVIIYRSMLHNDNHENYIKQYYTNLKVTEYIPILLTKKNYCILDLSDDYLLGMIYLPSSLSNFQKEYFRENKNDLEKYTLYLNNYSLEKPILINELLDMMEKMSIRPKIKKFN